MRSSAPSPRATIPGRQRRSPPGTSPSCRRRKHGKSELTSLAIRVVCGQNFVGSNDVLDSFPNTYDVGVVVLDQPVSIGTYGTIPEPGFLDALAIQPGQEQQSFTVVGYGLQGTHPDLLGAFQPQRQKATTQLADLGAALADGYNLLTPNNAAEWGSCYGDSGGPILLSGTSTVVAVTSFGLDPNCTGTNGGYRTDIADSQDFIRGYLG